jgi:ABC-type Fe3+-hydroxamate transport system substrate-binding protein
VTPRRIVSLVPSLTEALFALGLGERVVGVTEWCVHPAEGVEPLAKVGGTKNPDIDSVLALSPDLVIANREENRRRDVENLEAAGIRVWVTHPKTVRDGVALLGALADLGASPERRRAVVGSALLALARAEQDRLERRVRFVCPIWRDPWMVVGGDTYAHDLITLCGGENVFTGAGGRRYPRVELEEIEAAGPELILLPDEPYAFGQRDAQQLAALDVPAAHTGRIHLIDGTLVSWYGPRILQAIETLRALIAGATTGGQDRGRRVRS